MSETFDLEAAIIEAITDNPDATKVEIPEMFDTVDVVQLEADGATRYVVLLPADASDDDFDETATVWESLPDEIREASTTIIRRPAGYTFEQV
jgi:hypothetical protein